jgi:hypothetical protein
VVDAKTGESLGLTPLVLEKPRSRTPLTVRFDKPGFKPTAQDISLAQDIHETIALSTTRSADQDATPRQGPRPVPKVKKDRPHRPVVRADEEPAKL